MATKNKSVHRNVRDLLSQIEAYRRRTGESRTAFGKQATGDGHLLRRWENGRMPMFSTVDRVLAYLHRRPLR